MKTCSVCGDSPTATGYNAALIAPDGREHRRSGADCFVLFCREHTPEWLIHGSAAAERVSQNRAAQRSTERIRYRAALERIERECQALHDMGCVGFDVVAVIARDALKETP